MTLKNSWNSVKCKSWWKYHLRFSAVRQELSLFRVTRSTNPTTTLGLELGMPGTLAGSTTTNTLYQNITCSQNTTKVPELPVFHHCVSNSCQKCGFIALQRGFYEFIGWCTCSTISNVTRSLHLQIVSCWDVVTFFSLSVLTMTHTDEAHKEHSIVGNDVSQFQSTTLCTVLQYMCMQNHLVWHSVFINGLALAILHQW